MGRLLLVALLVLGCSPQPSPQSTPCPYAAIKGGLFCLPGESR
jgi:hypothetical protein